MIKIIYIYIDKFFIPAYTWADDQLNFDSLIFLFKGVNHQLGFP